MIESGEELVSAELEAMMWGRRLFSNVDFPPELTLYQLHLLNMYLSAGCQAVASQRKDVLLWLQL